MRRQICLSPIIAVLATLLCASPARAVTSEQLEHLTLRDDLQRNDPPGSFSSSGMGAGKWSTPTAFGSFAASRGGAYNGEGRLGYGSPGGWAAAYWNANSFEDKGNGVAVEATVTTSPKNGEVVALYLSMPSPTGSITGYAFDVIGSATPNQGTAYLYKWTNGSLNLLASSIAITNVGTRYALVEKNGEITVWGSLNGSGFVNPSPYLVTDSSPIKAGFAGIQVYGSAMLDNFSAGPLPPSRPALTSVSPASPGSTTTPRVIGSAEPGTTVNVYENSSCSGAPAAAGSASTVASSGIPVSVGKGSTTTFYATATNSDGLSSSCSLSSVTYKQVPPTIYWGAWVRTEAGEAPFNMSVESAFETTVGKTASLIHWSSPWYSKADCSGYCAFQTQQFDDVRSHGAIPFFSWGPGGASPRGSPPTDEEVVAGVEDPYLEAWAKAAKNWGHPLFLRFAWEMNGSWMNWGVGHEGHNTPADYVEMWKHVHDIFTKVGASNVSWVWCPNIDPNGIHASMDLLYPGDEYVDWTCLDGYNAGDATWRSFGELFGSSYAAITGSISPDKPMVVGETASTESGGSKSEWITSALGGLASNYPKIHGVMWFDANEVGPGEHTDWPIESSASATAAFGNAIQGGPFAPAEYGGLSASPIPPP